MFVQTTETPDKPSGCFLQMGTTYVMSDDGWETQMRHRRRHAKEWLIETIGKNFEVPISLNR